MDARCSARFIRRPVLTSPNDGRLERRRVAGPENTETSVSRASYLGENPPNPLKERTGG